MRLFQLQRRAPGWSAYRILFWWGVIRTTLRYLFMIFYRLRVSGSENVPPTGPIIYIANHQSHYDPILAGIPIFDRPFSGFARATLFNSKLLAFLIRSIGVIAVDQTKPDAAAMKAALSELKAGRCVLIFPEGSRTRDGEIAKFQRGVLLMIKHSGATIVPIAIEGAYEVWPIHNTMPKLHGRIAVKVGQPIPAQEFLKESPDTALENLRQQIDQMRLALRTK